MARMTYRELGQALNRIKLDTDDDAFDVSADVIWAVTNALVDFFRSRDPEFNEGEFVASTYGA